MENNNNKKLMAIIGAAAVAVIAVVLAIFIFGGDSDDSSNDSQSNTSTNESSTTDADAVDSDSSLADQVEKATEEFTGDNNNEAASSDSPFGVDSIVTDPPLRISFSGTESGQQLEGFFEVDSDNDFRSKLTQDGFDIEIRLVGDYAYINDGTSWIGSPTEEGNTLLEALDDIGLSEDDLEDIDNSDIEDLGTGSCTIGTCRIYNVADLSGQEAIVKVDESNGRFSDIEFTDSITGDDIKMSFEYSGINDIVAPASFEESPTPF